ncbi:Rv3235 family protein [Nesterenkonia sphaerica]|uniref:Uncharacterized protein n=1 Tax=Nesterenkonia sphaerica TaxID=1804988 RepID=A0A5R9A642_9MICC|nr:Rv3235 family protein [Nesterenkonia sphaerica]TLP73276.1 hypothetical protein FEF27_10245 [Nesterenkonia sphaerica]
MIPTSRRSATMVQSLAPPASRPLRARLEPPGADPQESIQEGWEDAEVAEDHQTAHPCFRIQREAEVPRLLRTIGVAPRLPDSAADSAADSAQSQRPDELATKRQERRQVVAVARVVCQATAETLVGLRPVTQLRRWLEAEVYHKVQQRAAIMARHRAGLAVQPRTLHFRSERACQPRPGCWEVSVVFSDELRARACAMRLEAHRGRWRVVAMELG